MQEGLLGDEEGRSASSPRTRRILGLVAVVAVVASVSCTATYFATRRPQGCVCRARRQSGALCFVCGVATRAYTQCSPSFPLYPSLPNHPSLLSRFSPIHSFVHPHPRHSQTIRPGRGFTPTDRGELRTTLARRTPLPRATRPSSSSIFRTFPASSPSYRSSKTSTST